jgi:dipeptidase D
MDIVTMGPKMQDIHTPQEALDLASFDATFTLLRAYLEEL